MSKAPDYRCVAKAFWIGRTQAVLVPAPRRCKASEVEVIKDGDQLTLRPRGKKRAGYVNARSHGWLSQQHQPFFDWRDEPN